MNKVQPKRPRKAAPSEQVLFADETRLSREEVLDRFFTPKETYNGQVVAERLEMFEGVGEYALIHPRSSFVMPQIRDSYDARHIERTGRHIRDSVTGQLQNCGLALLDEDNVAAYLADANRFFYSAVTLDDLTYHPVFRGYLITIFGHNRQLGVAAANLETNGHPDHGLPFVAKVFRNPPFWLALEIQFVENTGSPPAIWDRARSIVQYKTLRTRDGQPPTQSEVAKLFNVDTDQIWRAERYEALPDDIKELVTSQALPFSGVIELDKLFEHYGADEVSRLAHRLADRQASSSQIIKEVHKRLNVAQLPPEVYALVEAGTITLSQSQELNRLHQVGLGEQVVTETATWISLRKPDIDEIRHHIDDVIAKQLAGAVSMFEPDTELPLHERQRILQEQADQRNRELIRQSMGEVARTITGVQAVIDTGLAGGAVEYRPVGQNTRDYLGGLLEKLAGSEPLDTTTLAQMVTELQADPGRAEFDPVYTDALTQLAELVTSESVTTATDQALRRQAVSRQILELTTQPSQQPSLFIGGSQDVTVV